ncbi:MAG: hypothetical protein PSY14_11300 [bacterium]|nr:hypothetical protein [bacterium]
MTETREIGTIRNHFSLKAELPKKTIKQAEQFLGHLSETTPTAKDITTGHQLLTTLQEKTELYEFQAAVLAGQQASSEKDLDTRVSAIAKSAEQAERTTERLRSALKAIA